MPEDRPTDETPESIATQDRPQGGQGAPANGEAPGAEDTVPADTPPAPAEEAGSPAPEAPVPAPEAPVPEAPTPTADAPASEAPTPTADAPASGAAAASEAAAAAPDPQGAAAAPGGAPAAQTGKPPAPPRPKRPPRPREPLPWPELRAAATAVAQGAGVEDLKELFRLLPDDIRDETVVAVREYRKGARRPVSAFAGKSLARAVHTARRARRRPDSDAAVSEALGQALAAEVIASLDVEIAAEVILPKRDLLERESRNARRRQKADEDRTRDERRRRAREEGGAQGGNYGTYSGAKIRGLDELAKLFETEPPADDKS